MVVQGGPPEESSVDSRPFDYRIFVILLKLSSSGGGFVSLGWFPKSKCPDPRVWSQW